MKQPLLCMLTNLTSLLAVAGQAFRNLKANDPIRMAGATAFFTFFALPPIVIMLSTLLGLLFNHRSQRVSSRLFEKLALLFGDQSADQLADISRHLQQPKSTWPLTLLSIAILLLASTTLFAVIKNSLNQLWNVKARSAGHFGHVLTDKAIALIIILFTGLLFTATMTLTHGLAQVRNQLALNTLDYYEGLAGVGHSAMSVVSMAIWFAIIFKYLPDIRIRWKAVWVGALVTSALFNLGERLLDRLLIHSSIGSMYGASGAVILMLLFVFYASLIFYYGAAFTRHYAHLAHLDPEPRQHAVVYEITEVELPKEEPLSSRTE